MKLELSWLVFAAAAQPIAPPASLPQLRTAPSPADCNAPKEGDEIVVCGERESDERHRLPLVRDRRFDPRGNVDSVSRERNRLLGPPGGTLGACNNVGPNGMTGCLGLGVWQRREQNGR
ncbi:MAG TPA: hypothetical protein VF702_02540 [Allosphingosinicella sp.]|jgi:hypothetical protein